MLLDGRVRLIAQHDVHRRELDQPDLESKEEIFQHKMQAYGRVVFTPPTTNEMRAARSANTHLRDQNYIHGRIYLQDCWNIIKLEYLWGSQSELRLLNKRRRVPSTSWLIHSVKFVFCSGSGYWDLLLTGPRGISMLNWKFFKNAGFDILDICVASLRAAGLCLIRGWC